MAKAQGKPAPFSIVGLGDLASVTPDGGIVLRPGLVPKEKVAELIAWLKANSG